MLVVLHNYAAHTQQYIFTYMLNGTWHYAGSLCRHHLHGFLVPTWERQLRHITCQKGKKKCRPPVPEHDGTRSHGKATVASG